MVNIEFGYVPNGRLHVGVAADGSIAWAVRPIACEIPGALSVRVSVPGTVVPGQGEPVPGVKLRLSVQLALMPTEPKMKR
jgi:hypothetical protein